MSKCTSRASIQCTYLEHRACCPPTICGTLGKRGSGHLYLGDFNRIPFSGPNNAQYHPANFQVRIVIANAPCKSNENSAVILPLRA